MRQWLPIVEFRKSGATFTFSRFQNLNLAEWMDREYWRNLSFKSSETGEILAEARRQLVASTTQCDR